MKLISKLIFLTMISGSSMATPISSSANKSTPYLNSGIEQKNMDISVRPQDNFYTYVNGKWLEKTQIPADKSAWGSFYELRENTVAQLDTIIKDLERSKSIKLNSTEYKISNLYSSYMDEALLEKLKLKPITPIFEQINKLNTKQQIPGLIAYFGKIGVDTPYSPEIHQDARDSSKVIVDLHQSGLGLPDRDYYLKTDDAKLSVIRSQYLVHIEKMLSMSGDKAAHQDAANILALETKLAVAQWTKVQNRDPIKTYNKVALDKLSALTPNYDWNSYLVDTGLKAKISYVIVSQPSYLQGFAKVLQDTPLSVWQAYFKWQVLRSFASVLNTAYVDENFAFYGTILNGTPKQEPRYKRGIHLIEGTMGEGLGKLYVAKYFPAQNKQSMQKLVADLMATYKQSINELDWMSPATKLQAQKKLASMMLKIGYPDKWRDYSTLQIDKDDLVGNIIRANTFEYNRQLNKLGKPVDRAEWGMTPQTVNAYYNPELNEIVFPAAILQPPFFNVHADSAVNYGGIGAVIGHEISHAFDDQGSQYDEIGNLRDWWTKDDHIKFAAKTKQLVKQYAAYSPLPGYPVNGELTLGENIADNSGLAIAYKAYLLSLGGRTSPIIDKTTGEQRLYEGWAQVWRGKVREAQIINRIKTDPHSPPEVRGNATLRNQPGFYRAFDVKSTDKMYLPPEQRVIIW